MNQEIIIKFLKENENLINLKRWEEVYKKKVPKGFTETILNCGVNPLELGLNYIPYSFLSKSKIKEFTTPNNVTRIGPSAFEYCTSLTSVVIGDSVTIIGDAAFFGCSSLTNIEILDNVTSIGDGAFNSCTSLKSIEIPDSVISIGMYAFADCDSLTSIRFNGTVEKWRAIGQGSDWHRGVLATKIICTDGESLL